MVLFSFEKMLMQVQCIRISELLLVSLPQKSKYWLKLLLCTAGKSMDQWSQEVTQQKLQCSGWLIILISSSTLISKISLCFGEKAWINLGFLCISNKVLKNGLHRFAKLFIFHLPCIIGKTKSLSNQYLPMKACKKSLSCCLPLPCLSVSSKRSRFSK